MDAFLLGLSVDHTANRNISNMNLRVYLILLFGFFPFFSFAQWTNLTSGSFTRFEAQTVVHHNDLYVITGFTSGLKIVSALERYDVSSDTWTILSPMPLSSYETDPTEAGVTHMGVGLIGDSIWIAGGRTGSHPGTLTEEVWIYDINTDTWSAGPDLPLPLAGGGLVTLGRRIHVFGGFTSACNGDQSSYHLTLDVDEWLANPSSTWINERSVMPNPRNHLAATAFGGKIYAFGGQQGHDCCASGIPCGDDVTFAQRYDPLSDSWESLPNLPYARSHAEAAVFAMDGNIFLSSSETGVTTSHTTMELDLQTESWSINNSLELPDGILAPVIKPFGNQLFLLSGGYGGVNNPTDSAKVLGLSRTPQHTLGFSEDTVSFLVYQNGTTSGENFLWTVDGEATYALSNASASSWLTINQSGSDVGQFGVPVKVEVSASGLTEGVYYGQVKATGSGLHVLTSANTTFTPDSFVVRLEVGPSPDGILVMSSTDECEGVIVGSSSTRTISLTTPGAISVNISSISLGTPGEFQLLSPLPTSVSPGTSETVSVEYTPTGSGADTTEIIIVHDGPESPTTLRISCSANDPCTVPANWISVDLGSPTISGSGCESNGTYELEAGGKDIWSSADEGHFFGTQVVGDGEIIVRINSLDNVDSWTKAGLMMRTSLDDDSKNAFVCVTPGNGVAFQYRQSTGGSSSNTKSAGLLAPQWLRLTRVGNVLTGYFSSDGTSWNQVNGGNNPQTVELGDTVWVGLAMTSHDQTQLATAQAEQLSMTFSPSIFPVELLSFTGKAQQDRNDLYWESASETGFSHYEVTRMDKFGTFTYIGLVKGQGAGLYSWSDLAPLEGANVYRLSMVDLDGSVDYSPQIELTGAIPAPYSAIVFENQIQLTWNTDLDPVDLRVLDLTGRTVYEEQTIPSPGKEQTIRLSHLPTGWYHLQLSGKEELNGKSFLIRD